MGKPRDLTGRVFGRLTVVARAPRPDGRTPKVYWLCRCVCGTERVVVGASLINGHTVSCGCYSRELRVQRTPLAILQPGVVGRRFGRLLVLDGAGKATGGKQGWTCQCDCGNTIVVLPGNLKSGDTRSCGCLSREATGNRRREHGGYRTKEFRVWCGMVSRCHSPGNSDYLDYGGRGIQVCDWWRNSFGAFVADMGPRPFPKARIDRINNDGNYEPVNCLWTTDTQNARNWRGNHLMTLDGVTCTMAEWAERTGLSQDLLWTRSSRGWTDERALTTPNKGLGSNGGTYKCR